ncbi:CYFA0S03e02080g1_1 [Cyberlindnera fabianii]|uniref:CYFA0S03e02080g1_1 n=1 Tax=Cyberlindnera fabianii TaxID=36022 RepID=A0A061ANX3_CYBFA|nr:Ribosome assembly protein SQT1 [Cyberlindnera fabianii]CDR39312.1 CYFA0S03e02080g1_1 [Cyberlindnera fabianii]
MSEVPEEEQEFVQSTEVEEVVDEQVDEAEPMSEDEDDNTEEPQEQEDGEDEEKIEIDMSNNSWTYFDKHEDSVFTVFHHPKLPLACTGGGDNTAYLWTTHSQPPKLAQQLKGHKESVITGGFTGDGEFLITGDMAGKIIVHQARKGGQVWKVYAELEEIEEIVWITVHPSQPVFAFGGADGSVWVYQITPDLEQIMSGFSHQSETTAGTFVNTDDLDSLTLVTISTDGSIVGWNAYTATPYFKLTEADFKGLVIPWVSMGLQGKSSVLAVGSNQGTIAIVNISNGTVLTTFKVIELKEDQDELDGSVESISFSDTLPLMALGMVSGAVLLFDAKSWRERHSIAIDDAVTKVAFVPGTPYLVGSSMNGKIYKWDARTGAETFVGVGHNMGVLDFTFTEQGNKLITAGDEGVALIYKTEQ